MGEAAEYAASCPVCGGFVYLVTKQDLDEGVDTYYHCHSCQRIFSSL